MAFKKPNADQATVVVHAATRWEKAVAFINVSINTSNGKRKIGALPLKASKAFEAALVERLSGDEEAIAKMVPLLEFDFQLVNSDPIQADDLGF